MQTVAFVLWQSCLSFPGTARPHLCICGKWPRSGSAGHLHILLGMCRLLVEAWVGSPPLVCHRRDGQAPVKFGSPGARFLSSRLRSIPAGLLSMGMRSSASEVLLSLGFAAMLLSWIIYGERVLNVGLWIQYSCMRTRQFCGWHNQSHEQIVG